VGTVDSVAAPSAAPAAPAETELQRERELTELRERSVQPTDIETVTRSQTRSDADAGVRSIEQVDVDVAGRADVDTRARTRVDGRTRQRGRSRSRSDVDVRVDDRTRPRTEDDDPMLDPPRVEETTASRSDPFDERQTFDVEVPDLDESGLDSALEGLE
jgi:hypothetical protein